VIRKSESPHAQASPAQKHADHCIGDHAAIAGKAENSCAEKLCLTRTLFSHLNLDAAKKHIAEPTAIDVANNID